MKALYVWLSPGPLALIPGPSKGKGPLQNNSSHANAYYAHHLFIYKSILLYKKRKQYFHFMLALQFEICKLRKLYIF